MFLFRILEERKMKAHTEVLVDPEEVVEDSHHYANIVAVDIYEDIMEEVEIENDNRTEMQFTTVEDIPLNESEIVHESDSLLTDVDNVSSPMATSNLDVQELQDVRVSSMKVQNIPYT